jgi:hypothetical protein
MGFIGSDRFPLIPNDASLATSLAEGFLTNDGLHDGPAAKKRLAETGKY